MSKAMGLKAKIRNMAKQRKIKIAKTLVKTEKMYYNM